MLRMTEPDSALTNTAPRMVSQKRSELVRAAHLLVVGCMLLSGILLAQDERWVYTYDGSAEDEVSCITCDAAGNTYSAGKSVAGYHDFLVVSTSSEGLERWVYRYNGSANLWDWANAIASDGSSRIYAAGMSSGQGTAEDFTVVCLDTCGTEQWVYRYNGRVNSFDVAYCVTCGADGNIYAAGVCDSNHQFLVLSLTPAGTRRWTYKYDGPGSIENCGRAIASGRDGNVYVAGFGVGNGTWKDFTVVSLTNTGEERWVYTRTGSASWGADEARAVACDSAGNVYAAGWCTDSISGEDIVVVSLDSAGRERWVYRLDGPAGMDDEALSAALDSGGTVYVAGFSEESGGYTDLVAVSLSDSGEHRWTYRYDGGSYKSEVARWVTVGPTGDVYVAGSTCPTGWDTDFTIISLSGAGSDRWAYYHDGPAGTGDRASCVAVGNDGSVYAAGMQMATGPDAVVISVTPGVGTEGEKPSELASDCVLRSHPVPFAGRAIVEYSVPWSTPVMLAVFSSTGRLVRVLTQGQKTAGVYSVRWDGIDDLGKAVPPGAYICRLVVGRGQVRTTKMLCTR